MGYGPDQQLIRARPWKTQLRRGDALLLLTYHGNDFHDLIRTRHGGRSKPWIEESDGLLIEHKPAIDVFDHLRDRSYIFTLLTRSLARLDQSDHTERRLEGVDRLYQKWVSQQVEDLVARGVVVVIVHHGEGVRELPFEVEAVLADTCPAVSGCLALDQARRGRPSHRGRADRRLSPDAARIRHPQGSAGPARAGPRRRRGRRGLLRQPLIRSL
jgi:hypothetical protein